MEDMQRRTYTSSRRAIAAAATRDAILDAAQELFARDGYGRTSLADIARLADVAPNTVYVSVGGKPHLVTALIERSLAEPLERWSTNKPLRHGRDSHEIVASLVHNIRTTFEPALPAITIMIDSARADKQIQHEAVTSRARYRAILSATAEHLSGSGDISPEKDAAEVLDILWYYLNVSSWRVLQEMGWSWDAAEEWLLTQASRAIFGD